MTQEHSRKPLTCILCETLLEATNRSAEHIFPAALGGTLKSTQLICSTCNCRAGESIDVRLCDRLEFLTILFGVKHSTKRPSQVPELKFTAPDGRPLSYRPMSGHVTLEKPIVEERVVGELTQFTFTAPPGQLYEKHVARKRASIERQFGPDCIVLDTVEDIIDIAPPVPFSPREVAVDPEVKRAVAKIAFDYASLRLRSIATAEPDYTEIRSCVLSDIVRDECGIVPYPVGTSELCVACQPPLHCVACVRTARTLWAVVVIYGVFLFKVRVAANLADESDYTVAHLIDPLSHRAEESAEIADLALSLITRSFSMESDGREAFWCFLRFLATPAARANKVLVSEAELRPGLVELARGGAITVGDIEAIVADFCVSGNWPVDSPTVPAP